MQNTNTTSPNIVAEPIYSGTSTTASSTFTAFVLTQLRCAQLKAEIVVNQIEAATAALSAGMITAEQAILILAETSIEVVS